MAPFGVPRPLFAKQASEQVASNRDRPVPLHGHCRPLLASSWSASSVAPPCPVRSGMAPADSFVRPFISLLLRRRDTFIRAAGLQCHLVPPLAVSSAVLQFPVSSSSRFGYTAAASFTVFKMEAFNRNFAVSFRPLLRAVQQQHNILPSSIGPYGFFH